MTQLGDEMYGLAALSLHPWVGLRHHCLLKAFLA